MTEENPPFPPEIECEIFLIAFYNDPKGQATLLRVAKRVYEWLTPLLYNTVIISDSFMKFKYPSLTTLQRHGHHVHHLFLATQNPEESEVLPDLLPLCPNVSNLAMWFGTSPMPKMLALPVRRLAVGWFGFMQHRFDDDLTDMDIIQWGSNITHLAVGQELYEKNKRCLSAFPVLEYLMIYRGDDQCGFIEEAFRRCPRLKVVIEFHGSLPHYSKPKIIPVTVDGVKDIRVVELGGFFISSWYDAAQGQEDMWEVAEKEVERRLKASRLRA